MCSADQNGRNKLFASTCSGSICLYFVGDRTFESFVKTEQCEVIFLMWRSHTTGPTWPVLDSKDLLNILANRNTLWHRSVAHQRHSCCYKVAMPGTRHHPSRSPKLFQEWQTKRNLLLQNHQRIHRQDDLGRRLQSTSCERRYVDWTLIIMARRRHC